MRLSPHFTLAEMTKSRTALRNNIDNSTKDPVIIDNLTAMCFYVLEPIREKFGPFTPNSAYRSLKLNRLIGSRDSSDHVQGQAVDVEVTGVGTVELAQWCKDNLPSYHKIILEFYEPGTDINSGWVHISYRNPEENASELYTINKYGTIKGLPSNVA